jgi:hypothetical protein
MYPSGVRHLQLVNCYATCQKDLGRGATHGLLNIEAKVMAINLGVPSMTGANEFLDLIF